MTFNWWTCTFYLTSSARKYELVASEEWFADMHIWWDRNRDLIIEVKKAGYFVLAWKLDDRYRKEFHIIVVEPKQLRCEMFEWEYCQIGSLPSSYNYKVLKDWAEVWRTRREWRNLGDPMYVQLWSSTMWPHLEWLRSWVVDFELYKRDWFNQKLININTTIHEADFPIETPLCSTRVNGRCDIHLRNIGTNKYTYYVSDEWYLTIEERTDRLALFTTKEWELEILVKNNETWVFVHRAVIHISGEYKVYTPSEFSETEINLEVWWSKTIQILRGTNNSNYRVTKYSENVSVSYVWTDSFRITALDNSSDRVKIAFYDEDSNYSWESVYVNIVWEGWSGNDWWGEVEKEDEIDLLMIEDIFSTTFRELWVNYQLWWLQLANNQNKYFTAIKRINSAVETLFTSDPEELTKLNEKLIETKNYYKNDISLNENTKNLLFALIDYMQVAITLRKGVKGLADWKDQAILDHLSDTIAIANPLEYAAFIVALTNNIKDIVAWENPELYTTLKDSYSDIHDVISEFSWIREELNNETYIVNYYASYIIVTVALELNPVKTGKLSKLNSNWERHAVMEKLVTLMRLVKAKRIIEKLDYSKISRLENGVKQYIWRWWTDNSIEHIIKNPKKNGKSIDYISNPKDWDPAIVYYNSDNEYLVVNESNGKIIQISDKNDTDWKLDSRIYDLK